METPTRNLVRKDISITICSRIAIDKLAVPQLVKKLTRILWNRKSRCLVHKNRQLAPILK
jgi:hypothetical protein